LSGRIADILSRPLPTRRILAPAVDTRYSTADTLAGEPAVVEALIPGLRRFARVLRQGDRERADDLVQFCLEQVLAGRGSGRGELRPRLYAVLYSRFARERRRPRDDCAAPVPEGAQTPDLLGAFAKLPEQERSVLFLIEVDDFSYEQAALILDITVGAVMSHLSRGRERLRQALNSERAGAGGRAATHSRSASGNGKPNSNGIASP
jgi:RNA polymerase sigma-70 factor, ECF subfamily